MNKKNLLIIICSFSISAISSGVVNENFNSLDALVVHKTPACGCCKKWMKHLEENGFNLRPEDHQNLNSIKDIHNIKPEYRSCHTAVSKKGYIFEGHIPSKYIKQFLSEDHTNALGLSVPGMPLGSPGMEVDDIFTPYDVLILFKDGSSKVYAEIKQ